MPQPSRRLDSSALRNRSHFSSLISLTCRQGFEPSGRSPQTSAMFEHLGQHAERAVDLVGRVAHVIVHCDDVAPPDLGHLAAADRGLDEKIDRSPVFTGRARLAVSGHGLVEETLCERLHNRRLAVGVPLCRRPSMSGGRSPTTSDRSHIDTANTPASRHMRQSGTQWNVRRVARDSQ